MKILFVSLPSIHAKRWINNFKNTQHELYWFDILNRGQLKSDVILLENQFTNWKERKIKYIKGEYFMYKKINYFYKIIHPFLEKTVKEAFEEIIYEIRPDVVHSFEMHKCSYPLLKSMKKFNKIKWVYSCWGSDLYFYKNINSYRKNIKKTLKRVNYIFVDCKRDVKLARELGFNGTVLDIIPGGSGYKIENHHRLKNINDRNIILVKGYEHKFGRAINVIKALQKIDLRKYNYEIVLFGCHKTVIEFLKNNKIKYKYFTRHQLNHDEVLNLMGNSKIFIGNSISDGIPNTLLEAIIMGAYPIQSNPGGATEEIIRNGKNGYLINDPENISNIASLIIKVITTNEIFEKAYNINFNTHSKILEYNHVRNKILKAYEKVQNTIINA